MNETIEDPAAFRFSVFVVLGSAVARSSSHGWEVLVAFDSSYGRYASLSPPDKPAREAVVERIKEVIPDAARQGALHPLLASGAEANEPRLYAPSLRPGEQWPRIWRPGPATRGRHEEQSRAAARLALRALDRRAQSILEVVHPVDQLKTHGHLIRELLMLASMEVESSCKAVLRANGYSRERYSMNDYVSLAQPLFLRDYRLRLVGYPELSDFAPFSGWDSATPTRSLPWYGAYNLTKHSREEELGAAHLGLALEALAGAWALHAAQFGGARVGLVGMESAVEQDSSLFQLSPSTRKLESRYGYVAGRKPADLAFVNYDFGAA